MGRERLSYSLRVNFADSSLENKVQKLFEFQSRFLAMCHKNKRNGRYCQYRGVKLVTYLTRHLEISVFLRIHRFPWNEL